jgi:tetratricopeptide (TPR) repeat protein
MLFMFGGRGNQIGLFNDAQAIDVRNDRAYVLDSGRGNITVFELTEYGRLILLANHLYNLGEYEESIGPWEEVLRMDAGNTLAWRALGQAYYGRGDYERAMECFRLGMDRRGYSRAFGQVRDAWIKQNFSILVISIVCTVLVLNIGIRLIKKYKNGKKNNRDGRLRA